MDNRLDPKAVPLLVALETVFYPQKWFKPDGTLITIRNDFMQSKLIDDALETIAVHFSLTRDDG